MGLTALDIIVLLLVGGGAIHGALRGFVTETLSLMAWVMVVIAVRLFHAPLTRALVEPIGTSAGAAVLAFALLFAVTYFGGRMIANAIGRRSRTSVLGPVDRALGFGFGVLKGLIGASLLFLLMVLVFDTIGGGKTQRPEWMTTSRTYTLLDATSASLAKFADRRRQGKAIFGPDAAGNDSSANGSEQP